ncbi:hypothetical protein Cni_G10434 [Canna indica]|uniref:Reverse transcriptase domain-containing protein n=1 Tax=Canna indica TaxID=4628 RepID=A0AAQ3Q7B5_9LILI|nr:hypothetical protein Cni_G10434 [Canna indica]
MNPVVLKRFNKAHIVLIPKHEGANEVREFRPISLEHSIIRIFSKLLTRRLKPFMDNMISTTQGAFTSGRSSLDSYLSVHETIWACHKRNEDDFLIKVDFQKAFDSISWEFILQMLRARGFPSRWIEWMQHLLCTDSSLLINGEEGNFFHHRRGVRQGNPLSPYLFNLAIDCLSALLVKATANDSIEGVLGHHVPGGVTHSLFADDLVLFSINKMDSLHNLRMLLRCFYLATGLQANPSKTCVVHLSGDQRLTSVAACFLGYAAGAFPLKYLGLPLRIGNLLKGDWNELLERNDRKLADWKGRLLSRGGRLTLVNSTITSYSSYMFSMFKAPKWVLKKIDSRRRKFFWVGADSTSCQGRCLVNWDIATMPRKDDGLGILKVQEHNLARLGSWLWKFITRSDLQWIDIIKGTLGGRAVWFDSGQTRHASPIWKSILQLNDTFRAGLKYEVGNGTDIQLWKEPWCGSTTLAENFPHLFRFATQPLVHIADARILDNEDRFQGWNISFTTFIDISQMQQLARMLDHVKDSRGADTICWRWSNTMKYTARSLYQILVYKGLEDNIQQFIWQRKLPPKIAIYGWIWKRKRLPLRKVLASRGVISSTTNCLFCVGNEETHDHVFFDCHYTQTAWRLFLEQLDIPFYPTHSFFFDEGNAQHSEANLKKARILLVWSWYIWYERNRRCFEMVLSNSRSLAISMSVFTCSSSIL